MYCSMILATYARPKGRASPTVGRTVFSKVHSTNGRSVEWVVEILQHWLRGRWIILWGVSEQGTRIRFGVAPINRKQKSIRRNTITTFQESFNVLQINIGIEPVFENVPRHHDGSEWVVGTTIVVSLPYSIQKIETLSPSQEHPQRWWIRVSRRHHHC